MRLLVKALIWEFISLIGTIIITFSWFGMSINTLVFSVMLTVLKSIGLYYYLKYWKGIEWGK